MTVTDPSSRAHPRVTLTDIASRQTEYANTLRSLYRAITEDIKKEPVIQVSAEGAVVVYSIDTTINLEGAKFLGRLQAQVAPTSSKGSQVEFGSLDNLQMAIEGLQKYTAEHGLRDPYSPAIRSDSPGFISR